ncbi:hypothetical protein PYCC9005_001962 [Savitreella phatthalungensis]
MSSTTPFAFDQAIAVRPRDGSDNIYDGELLPGWRIGAVPHGGYLVSVMLRACIAHSARHHASLSQTDVIQVSLAFVVKAQLGACAVTVEPVKVGRSYTNYHVVLSQRDGDKGKTVDCVRGYVIMGNFSKEQGHSTITTPRDVPSRGSCKVLEPKFPEFRRVGNNFEYHSSDTLQADPRRERQWLRFLPENAMPGESFPDGKPSSNTTSDARRGINDPLALALVSDLMNPLPLRIGLVKSGWFPTLSLEIQFKAPSPATTDAERREIDEWCFFECETESIDAGRMDISTRCYDGRGKLVCISRHAALIVSAARNLSKRSSRESKV